MTERKTKIKKDAKELSPIQVYKLLPKTNCKECGEQNCLAFAVKLVNREATLEKCGPLLKQDSRASERLKELLKPAVKEVTIGSGDRIVKLGGKLVMYRHEFAYFNPTALAVDVTDEASEQEIVSRVQRIASLSFDYIGQTLKLDMMAVRSTSNDPERFAIAVKTVLKNTNLPIILCSLNPDVLKAGLYVAPKSRPLLYAATRDNWKDMADLALTYDCPLVLSAPYDLKTLRSLTKTLLEYGVEDLVLDPGTFPSEGLAETLNNFTMIRMAATERNDRLCGFPLLSIPITAWMAHGDDPKEIAQWDEACLASLMIVRYADAAILHSISGWSLLPIMILRQNIYTDPRKPVAVEPGLKIFGVPDENSPVMFTTNFALTYYTVVSDLESAKTNAYLIVVDTEGIAVDSAVAGRRLTAEKVADFIRKSGVESKVKHRTLIIPGKASRLGSDIEKLSGWQVLVGPKDSSDIPKFLQEKWQKQT